MSTPRPDGNVKALVFDVFGTVVYWRGSNIREGPAFGAEHGLRVDWPSFADSWRAGYRPAMQRVRSGALPWLKIDALHRLILEWVRGNPRSTWRTANSMFVAGDFVELAERLGA